MEGVPPVKLAFYTYSYIDRSHLDIGPVLEAVAAAGYVGVDISATWRAETPGLNFTNISPS